MKRRDFVKFLGVSAASLPLATSLAAMPETKSKIQLLESKIITLDSDVVMIDNIKTVKYRRNDNFIIHHDLTGKHGNNQGYPGRLTFDIEIEAYIDKPIWLERSKNLVKFSLKFGELKDTIYSNLHILSGRVFTATSYEVIQNHDSMMIVRVNGIDLEKIS